MARGHPSDKKNNPSASKDDDPRRQYGLPSRCNANFAWVQHFIHHLVPNGMAGFVLARCRLLTKSKAACVVISSDNRTSVGFGEYQPSTSTRLYATA